MRSFKLKFKKYRPMIGCLILLLITFSSQGQNNIGALTGQPAVGGWQYLTASAVDPSLPSVLLIGDSMLGGYGDQVVTLLKGKVNVDRWTTSIYVSDRLCDEMKKIVSHGHYTLIHFNEAGLHSLSTERVPAGQYGARMEKFIKALREAAPEAKLIWAKTTPVTILKKPGVLDRALTNIVVEHNNATTPLIKRYGIATDDLYTLMMGHLDLAYGDQWHWNTEGKSFMAKAVAGAVLKQLTK